MPIAGKHGKFICIELEPSLNEYCFSDHSIIASQKEFLSDENMKPFIGMNKNLNSIENSIYQACLVLEITIFSMLISFSMDSNKRVVSLYSFLISFI